MAGSEVYQIRPWKKFESSYRDLIKKHYKKDQKARQQFEELVELFIRSLALDPCCQGTDQERFPHKTYEDGFELRKKRWNNVPGLEGSSSFCRLFYLVCHQQKLVYPFWIYTHQEYGKPKSQPPDKDLGREIFFIKKEVKGNNSSL